MNEKKKKRVGSFQKAIWLLANLIAIIHRLAGLLFVQRPFWREAMAKFIHRLLLAFLHRNTRAHVTRMQTHCCGLFASRCWLNEIWVRLVVQWQLATAPPLTRNKQRATASKSPAVSFGPRCRLHAPQMALLGLAPFGRFPRRFLWTDVRLVRFGSLLPTWPLHWVAAGAICSRQNDHDNSFRHAVRFG